jgi:hypothetical protein
MEARARRIVVIGALVVIAGSLAALYIAAQPAIVIQRDASILEGLADVVNDRTPGYAPGPYELTAGSPWLRLVFVPMLVVGVIFVARPRVAGAVMWSLASLGVGALFLMLRSIAPGGLPSGAQVIDAWPRTALPIAIGAVFVAHAGLLAALAVASRRRPRAPLPRAVARVPSP